MNINEIMSSSVKSCHPDTSLDDVARMMWDNDCGAVPVVNDKNKPVGIVTDRDITMAALLNHRPLWELTAAQTIQGQHPCCCHQEDAVAGCLTKMEQNGVRRILVTNQDGTLAGIVSMGDIVAATAERKSRKNLGAGDLLGMLRQVSSHHANNQGPIAPA